MLIRENVPFSEITTMRIGGSAKYLIEIQDLSDINPAIDFIKDKNLNYFFIGNGANLIARDSGYLGILIKNSLKGIDVLSKNNNSIELKIAGGEEWDDLVYFTAKHGFSGIEAMAKIPGTVGAAPVQNIGAYGQEIKDTLVSVDVYDMIDKKIINLKNEELDFSYRQSIFNHGPLIGRYFILYVYLKLHKTSLSPPFYVSLQNYIEENHITDFSPLSIYNAVASIRAYKLPDPKITPSAGSFFKNIILNEIEATVAKKNNILVWPAGNNQYKVNSGWLLEQAGLKGKIFHGFKIHDKASLILINDSATTFKELSLARAEIIDIIQKKYGYKLEQEPVEIPVK